MEWAEDLARISSEHSDEECPVCLEPLGHGGDIMRTKCGHSYHCSCIVETLSDGSVRSCPLCRTDISQICDPKTVSGHIFTVICLLRIAFDRSQAATRRFVHLSFNPCLEFLCGQTSSVSIAVDRPHTDVRAKVNYRQYAIVPERKSFKI